MKLRATFTTLITAMMISLNAEQAISAEISMAKDEIRKAGELFKTYCEKCHGESAKGDGRMAPMYLKYGETSPTNFTVGYFSDRPDDYLRKVITDGGENNNRSKYMPPFKDELQAEDITLLVKLIRETGKARKLPK